MDGGMGDGGCTESPSVGHQIAVLDGVNTALWYPSRSPAQAFDYGGGFSGDVAFNGLIADPCADRFPLVLFSHGLSGCGTQSLFFTEALARAGYVVVAPDHADALCKSGGGSASGSLSPDVPFSEPLNWAPSTHRNRYDDVQKVLNALLADPVWADRIDSDRIGVAGHSLGGYTALGLAGAWTSWRDPRVKAALAVSPYALPFLAQGTLVGLSTPVMYQGAQFDVFLTPSLKGPTGVYAASPTPKQYVELWLGTHFEWTNIICAGRATVSDCLVAVNSARAINTFGIGFFDQALKGNSARLEAAEPSSVAVYQSAP